MMSEPLLLNAEIDTLPRLPPWVAKDAAQSLEGAAFFSGAALAGLQTVLAREEVPNALLRQRLALRAAEEAVVLSGRPERSKALRDAVYLSHPGNSPGPAGEILQLWQRAVARAPYVQGLRRALPSHMAEFVPVWLKVGRGDPLKQAASCLETVIRAFPQEEAGAFIMADAVLARALGWERLVPLLALGLKSRDLRRTGEGLRLACHRVIVVSAQEVVWMAHDLTRRVARLRAVTPKLRAKRAVDAVEIFLVRDALSPAALTPLMSDRAARRFCERLVALGGVRELTGRDTFRLYGV